ncbi:MAG: hypothetical protein ABWY29_09525 [Blastococcus sp.]
MSTPSEPQPPVQPAGQTPTATQEIPFMPPTGGPTGASAVQQLPPHPGATTPPHVPPSAEPMDGPQPTGPVDFVPGLPGVGTPPPPPPVRTAAHDAPAPPAATSQAPAPPAPSADNAAGPVWPDTLEPEESVAAGEKRKRGPRVRAPQDRAALVGLGLVVLSLALLELGLAVGFDGDSYWSVVPLWSAFATVCVVLALLVFAAFYRAGNRAHSGLAWRVAAGGLVGLAVFWLLVVLPVVATDRGFVLTAALAALGGAVWIGPRRKD